MRFRGVFLFVFLAVPARGSDADRFFDHAGPVPTIRVEIDQEACESLRREPRKYVHCTVRMGDKTWPIVGLHLKGAAGSFRQFDDRPALTLAFNQFDAEQRLLGVLDKVHLNNSVQDPRYMTEILCGELHRAAGVPCCRAAHALVEINDRKMGVYVVKEGFDTYFLKRNFHDATGNLYDGGFLTEIDQPLKRSHGSADVDNHADLKTFAATCREKDLTKRYGKMCELCDMDKFLAMMALEVATNHWDGYAHHKNNYRVYHDLKAGKLVFMPHGMDQMWGDPEGTIRPGFEGLVARKLLDTKEGREAYRQKLTEVMEKHYDAEALAKRIDQLVGRLKAVLENDKDLAKSIEDHNAGLKAAIKVRGESIRRQLQEWK